MIPKGRHTYPWSLHGDSVVHFGTNSSLVGGSKFHERLFLINLTYGFQIGFMIQIP
jgi:hypothetical protein